MIPTSRPPRADGGASASIALRTGARRRVLVVDDSNLMRAYYRSILEGDGHDVQEAQNGLEGLESAMRARPDLMIVDVNMPKLDGYRLMDELKREPELSEIPVIMISTEASAEDRRRALAHGASEYLVKPVTPDLLRRHLRALTDGTP